MALGAHFPGSDPWAEEPDAGLRTLTPVENLYTVVIHHFVGCPPGFWDFIKDLPFLSVSVWFLLYVFNCRRSLLVGSGLFHRWLFCK